MNKDELIEHFKEWRDNDENEKIIAAVIALPQSSVDDEILSWLAQAYIDKEEYKRAIAVLESTKERMDGDYKWQFMMGLALLRAADDDECEDDDELRRNILERAKVCLARGMNMNPPEEVLDSADRFMEEIECMLDEINGSPEEDYSDDIEAYDDDELDVLEEHIKDNYGDFPTVFHEMTSRDIILDVACIPPTKERNFFTLVTMGMGAHLMSIPEALPADENARAELLICLPPDWKLGESDEKWFWPIALLKDLAKLPLNTDSWLGWGHSVDHQNYLAPNTGFCGSLLLYPEGVSDEAEYCVLPNGDRVNFFEVIPLYREEMEYKISHDTQALLERMKTVSHVVDINRPNCCEGFEDERRPRPVDSAKMHSDKIAEKNLPLDAKCGCNHLAIFMRWCVEHDLAAPELREYFPEVADGVKNGTQTDLRDFILNCWGGDMELHLFNYMGVCFTDYYYNWNRRDAAHFYPADVDKYAESYFGTEKYNSEEFQDEAYLFVPFDEEYYKGLSKYIDRAFADFLPDFAQYRRSSDLELINGAKAELDADIILPKHGEFLNDFKNIAYMAKAGGMTALPILIDADGDIQTQEDVEDILGDAVQPFLMTLAIVKLPENAADWASENFAAQKFSLIPTNERIVELQNALKKELGAIPAVFTFSDGHAALLLPDKNGNYIRFMR